MIEHLVERAACGVVHGRVGEADGEAEGEAEQAHAVRVDRRQVEQHVALTRQA